MDETEDFDGSALRGLFTPVVADRGRTAAPADAIVAAGRRRVLGRRVAVAGGALAVVAAVPLTAAIAAGAGRTGPATRDALSTTTNTNTPTRVTAPLHNPSSSPAPASPSQSSPSPAFPSQSSPPSPATTTTDLAKSTTPPISPDAPLPAKPLLLGSGTLDGRHWEVSGVASGGNNAVTAADHCLRLLVTEDGRAPDPSLGVPLLYCLPGVAQGYRLEEMAYAIKNGAGSLAMGTISADVAKLVVHVDGVAAPITVATVPAPGVAGTAIYIVPVPADDAVHMVFDKYDAAGHKTGTFDNNSPLGTQ